MLHFEILLYDRIHDTKSESHCEIVNITWMHHFVITPFKIYAYLHPDSKYKKIYPVEIYTKDREAPNIGTKRVATVAFEALINEKEKRMKLLEKFPILSENNTLIDGRPAVKFNFSIKKIHINWGEKELKNPNI